MTKSFQSIFEHNHPVCLTDCWWRNGMLNCYKTADVSSRYSAAVRSCLTRVCFVAGCGDHRVHFDPYCGESLGDWPAGHPRRVQEAVWIHTLLQAGGQRCSLTRYCLLVLMGEPVMSQRVMMTVPQGAANVVLNMQHLGFPSNLIYSDLIWFNLQCVSRFLLPTGHVLMSTSCFSPSWCSLKCQATTAKPSNISVARTPDSSPCWHLKRVLTKQPREKRMVQLKKKKNPDSLSKWLKEASKEGWTRYNLQCLMSVTPPFLDMKIVFNVFWRQKIVGILRLCPKCTSRSLTFQISLK